MYRLNCMLFSSVSNACRQLAVSLNAGNSFGLQRALLCSSAVKLEAAASSADSKNTSRDFSHLPPMPGEDSSLRWAGKKFEELPIIHIKATYNNTHIQLTNSEGQSLIWVSCGTEGFKNIKKSMPLAAQTTGISAATKATEKGVTYARVVVKGLGPGRQAAIKGLAMGGLQVVSITDNTPVPHNGCRPRKARRI